MAIAGRIIHGLAVISVAGMALALAAPVLAQDFDRDDAYDQAFPRDPGGPIYDPPIGGAAVGGAPDGLGDPSVGGPAVGGAAAGVGDPSVGGPTVGGAPAGIGDSPIGGPSVGGGPVGDAPVEGEPLY